MVLAWLQAERLLPEPTPPPSRTNRVGASVEAPSSVAHGTQPMWSTREELEAALRQAGLGEWAPRLAAGAAAVHLIAGQ